MKKPKLIQKYVDTADKITSREYKFASGVRLVVSDNPVTVNFDLSVIVKAGSRFEHEIGVPEGTAHLLEHILFGQPNKRHKSQREIEDYLLGNKTRPSIYANASVSRSNMYFYGSSHQKGALRLLKSLRYRLDYPLSKIEEYLNDEKKVVLAELAGMRKIERDENVQSVKLFVQENYKDYSYRIIGDQESIDSITADHLRKFHRQAFVPQNIVIAVQKDGALTDEEWGEIDKIQSLFKDKAGTRLEDATEELNQDFRIGYFHEPNNQSAFVSLSFFFRTRNYNDYEDDVLWYLTYGLIRKVMLDQLRTERKLIYGVSTFNSAFVFGWRAKGFKFECELDNFEETVTQAYEVLHKEVPKFLETQAGKKWFVSRISDYIFPSTKKYSTDYAEDIAVQILFGDDYTYNDRLANRAAKAIAIEDLSKFVVEQFSSQSPKVWLVSPQDGDRMQQIVLKSKWNPANA